MSDQCLTVLKSEPTLQVPGFSVKELAASICRAVDHTIVDKSDLKNSIKKARTTRWPNLSKSVEGGLQHVVSVDNGANYAELWYKGGSWYAVTGAELSEPVAKRDSSGAIVSKSAKPGGIYAIPQVYKGAPMEYATARFMYNIFGFSDIKKGGCGCGGK